MSYTNSFTWNFKWRWQNVLPSKSKSMKRGKIVFCEFGLNDWIKVAKWNCKKGQLCNCSMDWVAFKKNIVDMLNLNLSVLQYCSVVLELHDFTEWFLFKEDLKMFLCGLYIFFENKAIFWIYHSDNHHYMSVTYYVTADKIYQNQDISVF